MLKRERGVGERKKKKKKEGGRGRGKERINCRECFHSLVSINRDVFHLQIPSGIHFQSQEDTLEEFSLTGGGLVGIKNLPSDRQNSKEELKEWDKCQVTRSKRSI